MRLMTSRGVKCSPAVSLDCSEKRRISSSKMTPISWLAASLSMPLLNQAVTSARVAAGGSFLAVLGGLGSVMAASEAVRSCAQSSTIRLGWT
jgi:hypothetical protein